MKSIQVWSSGAKSGMFLQALTIGEEWWRPTNSINDNMSRDGQGVTREKGGNPKELTYKHRGETNLGSNMAPAPSPQPLPLPLPPALLSHQGQQLTIVRSHEQEEKAQDKSHTDTSPATNPLCPGKGPESVGWGQAIGRVWLGERRPER